MMTAAPVVCESSTKTFESCEGADVLLSVNKDLVLAISRDRLLWLDPAFALLFTAL